MTPAIELPPLAATKRLTIKVFGVGGAGGALLEQMANSDLAELSFSAVHTNARVLAGSAIPEKFLLGDKRLRGLGTGGDPEMGRAAAEEEIAGLTALCAETDLVFIAAGLGGGTGTGVSPVLARVAKESGALVLAIVTLPFEFEGPRRQRQAQAGLQQLKAAADGVICLPNRNVAKLLAESTSLLETFKVTNDLLAQGVRGIWQMLTRPGLMKVDFADLASVLRGRHAESSFAMAEARGDGRATEVMEKLLGNPLLEDGQALSGAEAILVSIVGGPDLTMGDVNRVMQQINTRAQTPHLVMGAAIDEAFHDRLAVTLVASRRGQSESPMGPELAAGEKEEAAFAAAGPEIDTQFFQAPPVPRPASRFVAPAPSLPQEKARQLFAQQGHAKGRARRSVLRWRQGQLPLEIVSKGRFEKSEPTIHRGEDLDVPTYIRRGVVLN